MRLIKQLARLESAAAARAAEPAAVGLVWSSRDERVEASALAPGEYVAVDVHIIAKLHGTEQWSVAERVTTYEWDLGVVYNSGGDRIGRVVAVDGSLVTLEYDEGA